MFAKFFKPATLTAGAWSSFGNDFLFAADHIVSYEYGKLFSKVGSFCMELPFSKVVLNKLKLNGTIFYDKDWLWVQDIDYDGKLITLSGTDCKGFLDTRISLFADEQHPGTQGYDVATGSTKTCVAHYIHNNCQYGGCESGRELPIVDVDGASGLMSDSYMARLEPLSDIVSRLCDNAGIGYDIISPRMGNGFVLRLVQGTDRSAAQSDHPRVIFSVRRGNVLTMRCEHGVADSYNVIYGVDSNETVLPVHRATPARHLQRRECTASISEVTAADPLFEKYALHAIDDNVETHSYELDAAVKSGYRDAYDIGDIVSVQDAYTNNMASYQITAVNKLYRAGQQSVSLTFGTPKQKPLQRIVNDFLSGTARRR